MCVVTEMQMTIWTLTFLGACRPWRCGQVGDAAEPSSALELSLQSGVLRVVRRNPAHPAIFASGTSKALPPSSQTTLLAAADTLPADAALAIAAPGNKAWWRRIVKDPSVENRKCQFPLPAGWRSGGGASRPSARACPCAHAWHRVSRQGSLRVYSWGWCCCGRWPFLDPMPRLRNAHFCQRDGALATNASANSRQRGTGRGAGTSVPGGVGNTRRRSNARHRICNHSGGGCRAA
mmetsp:Transcript_102993/g.296581  ORF Transcript_102993/g.296581 Transcript_102993/m.296581 type:complete len:235 (-) Transcript_102993:6063-6767(-)